MTNWHVKGFWVPPASCSTSGVMFVYTVSPGRKPASFKWTIGVKILRKNVNATEHLDKQITVCAPGAFDQVQVLPSPTVYAHKEPAALGQPSASFYPNYRGLNFGIVKARGWVKGTEEGPRGGEGHCLRSGGG